MVTVQLSLSRSCAIGFPTMFERPTTTASSPARSPRQLAQQHQATHRGTRHHRILSRAEKSDIRNVKPIDILRRIDRIDHQIGVQMVGQRQLGEIP